MKPVKVLAVVLLVAAVGAASYYLGRRSGAHAHTPGEAAGANRTLYTCGMHPNVIQDKPGNCPICGMKLTPIKRSTGGAAASGASGERKIKYWRAPMDPTYISDKPGKSPMGMDLVPVYEDEAAEAATSISIDPVTIQNMGIRTGIVTNGPLRRVIRTVATIEYGETGLADVTTKFKGWVEKLYVDTTGAQVHRGDPLFEVYSPELYSAQTEYLLALASASPNVPGQEALLETARTKLKYWDVSDAQIAELDRTRKPQKTLQVLAPIDGFVTEKMVVEGQMVDMGMKLYRIADLGLVWVYAQIYEQDLPFIRLGQEAIVSLSYLPDRKFRGRLTYIYPNLDPKTRTVQVRMEFHNPGYFLKPGMFASVELRAELSRSALLVPDMAVLRSGAKNTVFVALADGKFEPRAVSLGVRAEDDLLQVLGGLEAGERVVVSGQFMLDSESQLREAIQKMLNPPAPGATPVGRPAQTVSPESTPVSPSDTKPAEPAKAVYLCPMPEHVAIQYDHPGKCPLCGMALVPVSAEALGKIQPGGVVEHYTCPMPEHADVKLDKPGKCPHCRMTLIPVMPKPPDAEPMFSPVQPEASLPTLYTCPMASHAHVVFDKPGQCPECEMKLIEASKVKHQKQAEEHWRKQHPATSSDKASPQATLYTCPMKSHAHVVSDQPGKCPDCEMDLVPTSAVKHGKTAEEAWRKQKPEEHLH